MLNILYNFTHPYYYGETLIGWLNIFMAFDPDTIILFNDNAMIRPEICQRITELVLSRQPKPIFSLVVPEMVIGLALVYLLGNLCCNKNYLKNDDITNAWRRCYLGLAYFIALMIYYKDFSVYLMSSSNIIDTSFSVLISKVLLICFTASLLVLNVSAFKQVYYTAVLLFFSLGLVSAANIILFYICFEALSLTSYGLIASSKTNGSIEAALKYFCFGLFGSTCLGFGLTLLSFEVLSFNLNDITAYIPPTENIIPELPLRLVAAIFLILMAFAFKLSLFPFHLVLPDVYEGSTWFTISAINISIKLPITFTLIRFWGFLSTNKQLEAGASYFLVLLAIGSISIGCLGALTQTSLKRFFSYTSINQLGFITLGLSNSSFLGVQSSFIYLVSYMCIFLLFFIVIVGWVVESGTILDLEKFTVIQKIVISIALFSMMGMPPFIGFMGKYLVWAALIDSIVHEGSHKEVISLYILAFIISLITSLVSSFYYLRLIKIMFINEIRYILLPPRSLPILSLIVISIICSLSVCWPIYWAWLLKFSTVWAKCNYTWIYALL
jgi:NADH-quinone oxidoreductase subunit N